MPAACPVMDGGSFTLRVASGQASGRTVLNATRPKPKDIIIKVFLTVLEVKMPGGGSEKQRPHRISYDYFPLIALTLFILFILFDASPFVDPDPPPIRRLFHVPSPHFPLPASHFFP